MATPHKDGSRAVSSFQTHTHQGLALWQRPGVPDPALACAITTVLWDPRSPFLPQSPALPNKSMSPQEQQFTRLSPVPPPFLLERHLVLIILVFFQRWLGESLEAAGLELSAQTGGKQTMTQAGHAQLV